MAGESGVQRVHGGDGSVAWRAKGERREKAGGQEDVRRGTF